MISPADLDTALRDLAVQARDLRGVSRTNPHQFLEDKQELARAIDQLRARVNSTPPSIPPDRARFHEGAIASRAGRVIPVERRRAAA